MFCLFKMLNSRSFRLQSLYFILLWSDVKSSRKDFSSESRRVLCRARNPVSIAQKEICLAYFGNFYFSLSPPFESLNKKPVLFWVTHAHRDSWIYASVHPCSSSSAVCSLLFSSPRVCFLWCELCIFSATCTYLHTYGKVKCSKLWNF